MIGATRHWIPERLVPAAEAVCCAWVDIGDIRFTDPFFDMTLARRRGDFPERRSSTMQTLHDEAADADALSPTAFVFHVSRCGSTLLSQLFGCDDAAVVLSEVPVLDELLRSHLPDREALFASALRVLARRRFGTEERLFVKTDSWHIFYADVLRRLYPTAPFVLLYRSPEAVLESHRRERGMHMVPGLLERAPFTVEYDSTRLTLDQYAAAVLELYYRAMLDVAAMDGRAALVSYEEGFPAAFERIAAWLRLPIDERLREKIDERCVRDAKNPITAFRPPEMASTSEPGNGTLRHLFERLEGMRLGALR